MLTQVYLDGALGKQFGRKWELAINCPVDALRLIDANKPGVFAWIKQNLGEYDRYRIICEFEDGRIEELDNQTVFMESKPIKVRFVPLVVGSSGAVRFVVGAILTVVGFFTQQWGGAWLMKIGVAMMVGGVIEMLSPRPKNDETERKDKTSHYFDGPVNTTMQGVPVPLIYGTVRVGSHHISASLAVDQLIDPDYVPPPPQQTPPPINPWNDKYGPSSGPTGSYDKHGNPI